MELLTKSSTNRLTLRLQTDILEILKREANKKDLTLNALISKILNKNIAYEETVNATPTIILPHDLFSIVIDKMNESDGKDLAMEGPRIVKKLFNITGIPYDIDHVIHNYFMMLDKYCNWFEFTHKGTAGKYRLVFCTGSNEKWAGFLQIYIRTILESLKIIISNESHHDGILVFEFSHKGYI